VLFFAVIAALVDLGEEIAADSMDIKGDKLIDSKSLAIKHGKEKALRISTFIFVLVILLSIIPFLLQWFNAVYLIPIIVMDIFIGYSTFRLIRSKDEEGRKYIRSLYLGATFGLLVFLIMRMMGF
jgi:geranylgeranylglycerol-phosphate geranylgeranyltransferase